MHEETAGNLVYSAVTEVEA